MRARKVPPGLDVQMLVDGRRITLPRADQKPDELAPQILLHSSGDLNLFELQVRRGKGGPGYAFAPSATSDTIEAVELEPDAP
jgi:hypothetical protein